MARLVLPSASIVPIREALLKPLSELIKAALVRDYIAAISVFEKQVVCIFINW